jgi:ATP-dependent HslUV protease subunit HslV
MENNGRSALHGTTIVAVRDAQGVAMAGDGQITLGGTMAVKHGARKVRRLFRDRVLCGFAGSTADALTLVEKFEGKLEEFGGNLARASVELAKLWRSDRYLRRLEAMLLVADADTLLVLSGQGDVIEPDDGVAAIGSGGGFALAAAKALRRHAELPAADIVRAAMAVAAEICVYTNDHVVVETLRRGDT